MSKRLAAIPILAALITGCANKPLPYDAWWLGFGAPNYMEVWIETADVVDVQGHLFTRAMSGTSAIQTPPDNQGDPRGWTKRPGSGKGKFVYGADLPKTIYVRWQSIAEPQVYRVLIDIPESVRTEMVKGERAYCMAREIWKTDYRKGVVIHLAPGGIAKVWVSGPCLEAIEVGRFEGEVVTAGPRAEYGNNHYMIDLDPESKAYIKKFGIPFDSW
ncbi:DUF2931 family protein [Pseudomonas sp. R5(2019)]|nr:DUF2931 family protein [Pseudomonas sp. R5(2019)]